MIPSLLLVPVSLESDTPGVAAVNIQCVNASVPTELVFPPSPV